MPRNNKETSARVASLAAKTLEDKNASHIAKQLAASALAQSRNAKQTGAEMEDIASRVLKSEKYSDDTKTLAASVLAQSNKRR